MCNKDMEERKMHSKNWVSGSLMFHLKRSQRSQKAKEKPDRATAGWSKSGIWDVASVGRK